MVMIQLVGVMNDEYEMISWSLWGKYTCKNVSTPKLKSVFEREFGAVLRSGDNFEVEGLKLSCAEFVFGTCLHSN
ncbi:hypothetical protein A2U01_0050952, partial [Trifolium medium]|nr:hypothetical protein [Trifolium medium]